MGGQGREGKEAGGRDGAMERRPKGPGSLSRHERGRGGCWPRRAAAAGVHGPAGAGGGGAPGREWGWGCGGAPPEVGEPGKGEPQQDSAASPRRPLNSSVTSLPLNEV